MMQVAAATSNSGGSSSGRSLSGTDDFMTLLVAQLKAQDPLSPMDPTEFMSQLAQLQSVAELQKIGDLLADASFSDAVNLIGRTVQWTDSATGNILQAPVDRIELYDGMCRLVAGNTEFAFEDIISINA